MKMASSRGRQRVHSVASPNRRAAPRTSGRKPRILRPSAAVSAASAARACACGFAAPDASPCLHRGHVLETEVAGKIKLLVLVGIAAIARALHIDELGFHIDRTRRSISALGELDGVDAARHRLIRVGNQAAGCIHGAEPDSRWLPLTHFAETIRENVRWDARER